MHPEVQMKRIPSGLFLCKMTHRVLSHVAECSDSSVLLPANGGTIAPGIVYVDIEYSISNFELGIDGDATFASINEC